MTFILGKYWESFANWKTYFANSSAVNILGAVLCHPCCKGNTPLKKHSKSYKATKGNDNVWLATSSIMIQLCSPHTPHWPLLKGSPQQQPCLQQQCCMEYSAHMLQNSSCLASPSFAAVGPVIWQERVPSIWLSPDSRRTSKQPPQEEKLETSDLVTLEASEHCGGTQSSGVRGFLLSCTGGAQTCCLGRNAALHFPCTTVLGCVLVLLTLSQQPAGRSHCPAGNKQIVVSVLFGCCLEFP